MTWGKPLFVRAMVLGAALLLPGRPASAQTYTYVLFGNASYAGDAFCLASPAFLTSFMAGISTGLVGFSAQYINNDWPWPDPPPPPPPPGGELFLVHGKGFQFQAELNPVDLVRSNLDRYIRPFIAAGLHVSTDGDASAATATRGPTYGVKGQTKPYVAYGFNTFVPIGSARIAATAGYRGTTVFFGEFGYATPTGESVTTDGATLTSGVWTVGLAVRVGG
jgi:hypothetical protein